jgi:hypothetical protein
MNLPVGSADEGAWETVQTLHDYWDGPLTGVADYCGVPHAYNREWNEAEDDWSIVFRLSPLNREQFLTAMEAWAIWGRWKEADDAGTRAAGDDHPALAVDRERYEAMKADLDEILRAEGTGAFRATAEFRGTWRDVHDLQVRWSPLGGDAA